MKKNIIFIEVDGFCKNLYQFNFWHVIVKFRKEQIGLGAEKFPERFYLGQDSYTDLHLYYEERTAHIGIQQKLEDGDIAEIFGR